MSGASAKKYAPRTLPGPARASVPSGAIVAAQGEGRGMRAATAANSGACAPGAPSPAGRSSRKSPLSGMQTLAQTSHSACSLSASGPAGPLTVTGSSTSPR